MYVCMYVCIYIYIYIYILMRLKKAKDLILQEVNELCQRWGRLRLHQRLAAHHAVGLAFRFVLKAFHFRV